MINEVYNPSWPEFVHLMRYVERWEDLTKTDSSQWGTSDGGSQSCIKQWTFSPKWTEFSLLHYYSAWSFMAFIKPDACHRNPIIRIPSLATDLITNVNAQSLKIIIILWLILIWCQKVPHTGNWFFQRDNNLLEMKMFMSFQSCVSSFVLWNKKVIFWINNIFL